MPIKNMTGRQPMFPEIGQIRKGKKRDPNKPHEKLEDLDYFRIEVDPEETAALVQIHKMYGTEPKEIDILLPFPHPEHNWITWREAYLAGGLIHRCDGEFVQYEIDNNTGETIVYNGLTVDGKKKPCDGKSPVGTYYSEKKKKEFPFYCKPVGRLKVILPVLARAVFFTVLTGAKWDIVHLDEQLAALYLLNGKLSGIPLKLRRRDREVSCPMKGGKRVRRTKSLLSIEADPQWTKERLMLLKAASLPGNGLGSETPLLSAPDEIEEEENPEEVLSSPADGGDYGDGFIDDEMPLEVEAGEVPYPKRLTATAYYELAKDSGCYKEAQAIMRENNNDLRKSWSALLKGHVPPDLWPK